MPVVVWEISDRDERSLDYYEGYPRYYIKEEWPVRMDDGSEMQGMIYLMADIHEHPPTREYYGGIERAYHELGLTEEIAGVLGAGAGARPAQGKDAQRNTIRQITSARFQIKNGGLHMHTIVIKVWRGIVSEVYSDDPNTEIVILDEDRTDAEDIPQIELPAHQVY